MRHPFLAAAAVAALSAAAPALAEPYVVDESHSHITSTVDHLGFSAIHGRFRDFDAEVDFDPEAVEDTQVRFTIDPASVDTNWDKRDAHLRSGDFFSVEEYPQIVFQSTEVTPTGPDTAEVTGDLTIKDTTREVTFDAELNKLGPSPFDPDTSIAGFTATGAIDRTEFDLGYGAPEVAAQVPIRVELEMSPAG